MGAKARKAFAQWQRLGTLRFLQLLVYRLFRVYRISDFTWDRRLRITTRGYLSPREFGILDESCHPYAPISHLELAEAMRYVECLPGKDVFLDLGSGMGRVVISAARYRFKRVIGVEICPEFNEIARHNVARARTHLACQDIELIVGDAGTYQIPDNVSLIFLYNPFGGKILKNVLHNIYRSLQTAPRALSVIYFVPWVLESEVGCPDWLVKRPDFVPLNRHGAIYEARVSARQSSADGVCDE